MIAVMHKAVLPAICNEILKSISLYLCSLVLECGLDLLASLANQLRHDLLIIITKGEVGGDAAVVPPQQPNGCSVICSGCILFCVIVPNRYS